MSTTKHYVLCWKSTFQPKKPPSGVALRLHGLSTAVGTRKLPQDDLNGDTVTRISRTNMVIGASRSTVNGSVFPAEVRLLLVSAIGCCPDSKSLSQKIDTFLYFIQCCPRLFRTPRTILIVTSPARLVVVGPFLAYFLN